MQTAANLLQKLTLFRTGIVAVDQMTSENKTGGGVQIDDGINNDNRMTSEDLQILRETIYDLIKDIGDPEKPQTLSELDVVSEDNVLVRQFSADTISIQVTFIPTVPHCSLAALIGLCLRKKLTDLPEKYKLDIFVKEGTHDTADEINKQINDKERIAAAMENPNLRDLVDKCINFVDEYG